MAGPDEERSRVRTEQLDAPRPKRSLPIAPIARVGARGQTLEDGRTVDKEHRPIYAVWEITLACDLACRHCGSRAGKERPDELSPAEALDVVDQLAALGTLEITLIGGEAYLRNDWLDIVRRISSHGIAVSMTTGGRGLTPELVALAKAAGLDGVSVSIDGDEETHDRLRGVKGSYRSAIAAMQACRDAGMRVACNTQINRLSLPHLPALLETIASNGIHAWQMQITVPMGRAADEPEVLLQPFDLLDVHPMLAHLKGRCDELGVRLWAGNNIGYFGPHESTLRGRGAGGAGGHGGSCGAGRSTIGIEANGAVKGCPSLPTEAWTGGNLRDHKLVDIWERAKPLRYTRDRTVRDLWGFCATCYYADECRSGCTWTSVVTLGKPGNNPYCHHRALEFQRIGKRERIVKTVEAEGMPFDHGVFEIVIEDIGVSSEKT